MIRPYLCYLLFPCLFTRLWLDHLVDVILRWNTHRAEARRRNLLWKGCNKDIARIQLWTFQGAAEVCMVQTERKFSFSVSHGRGKRRISDDCVIRKYHSCNDFWHETPLHKWPLPIFVLLFLLSTTLPSQGQSLCRSLSSSSWGIDNNIFDCQVSIWGIDGVLFSCEGYFLTFCWILWNQLCFIFDILPPLAWLPGTRIHQQGEAPSNWHPHGRTCCHHRICSVHNSERHIYMKFNLHRIYLAKTFSLCVSTICVHHEVQAKVILWSRFEVKHNPFAVGDVQVSQDGLLLHSLVGVGEHHGKAVQPANTFEVIQVEGDPSWVLPAADTKLDIFRSPGSRVPLWARIAVDTVSYAAKRVALFIPARIAVATRAFLIRFNSNTMPDYEEIVLQIMRSTWYLPIERQ